MPVLFTIPLHPRWYKTTGIKGYLYYSLYMCACVLCICINLSIPSHTNTHNHPPPTHTHTTLFIQQETNKSLIRLKWGMFSVEEPLWRRRIQVVRAQQPMVLMEQKACVQNMLLQLNGWPEMKKRESWHEGRDDGWMQNEHKGVRESEHSGWTKTPSTNYGGK